MITYIERENKVNVAKVSISSKVFAGPSVVLAHRQVGGRLVP
jgi:stress-induced morphogen